MECTTQEVIEKARIHCPTCKRDYTLYRLDHVCNPVLPCDRRTRRPKYIERYIDNCVVVDANTYVPIVACDPCNEADKLKSTPRKQMCPKCEYVGFYVADESKLCPVCRIVPQDKPKKRVVARNDAPPASSPTIEASSTAAPLPVVHLYATVTLKKKDDTDDGGMEYMVPNMGVTCTHIEVVGWTSESVLSGNWFPVRWGFAFTDAGEYSSGMKSLATFLNGLRQTYKTRWEVTSMPTLELLWIYNLFHVYGPEDKSILGYYV